MSLHIVRTEAESYRLLKLFAIAIVALPILFFAAAAVSLYFGVATAP